jgi:hypothetical protein
MPTETLAPADFDLDLHVAAVAAQDDDMPAHKTGVIDVCSTVFWPCAN